MGAASKGKKAPALVRCCLHSSTLGKVQNRGKNRLLVVQGGSLNKGKSKGIKHLKTPFYLRDERETDKTRVTPSVTKQT